MFDVGFSELFLLFVIALLVLGPERLPAVARTLGGLVRRARTSWYNLKRSIEAELAASEIKEPLQSARTELQRVSEELTRPMGAPATGTPGEQQDPETGAKPPPA